ncbi:hypothetical protein QQ045_020182 [Rhodiola kirilowii]
MAVLAVSCVLRCRSGLAAEVDSDVSLLADVGHGCGAGSGLADWSAGADEESSSWMGIACQMAMIPGGLGSTGWRCSAVGGGWGGVGHL